MTKDALLDKLYRLEKQRLEVEGMKKSMASDYRDQLKDLKGEIKDVMDELDEPAPSVGSEPVDFEK
jgi:hypothetical protein